MVKVCQCMRYGAATLRGQVPAKQQLNVTRTNQEFDMYLTTENILVLDGVEYSTEQVREGLRLLAMAEKAERCPHGEPPANPCEPCDKS